MSEATNSKRKPGRPPGRTTLFNLNFKVPELTAKRYEVIKLTTGLNHPKTFEAMLDKWEGKTSVS
jgi:hypothetical protein